MARMISVILVSVVVYVAAIGRIEPWDIVLATIVATGSTWLFRKHLFRGPSPSTPTLLRRLLFFPLLSAYIIWDIIRSTVIVTAYSLHLRKLEHPGIVSIPMGDRTRFGVTMSGFLTTVSPGTFLVDLDWTERTMLIHAIDATDPDAVRASHQRFYDRFQRHVFP
ncbi:MAG TPA: Na+/H+ antiporter subunit E [Thermomicrobiales bacterium]|jgi:multisubunit Na+/H+ antiporter MnhE subunit|nr:Na+/H+ antiporter subunit E [Thermomicrobiales bacterium]